MRRLRALVVTIVLCFPAAAATAQNYTFIVTGDGRSDEPARPEMDADGLNTKVLTELVTQILHIKPRFVLFTGDLVHGFTTEQEFRTQLQAWLEIMKPVYQAGIHVYPVRGNHDVSSVNAEKVWDEVFSGPYALPDNGPEGEKNVTFAASEENALVIGVDQFGGHPHAVNLAWLRDQLTRNTRPLIFVFGHEMAFRAGRHIDNLDNNPALRDEFIEALSKAGARVYFAGHDHFYDHQAITDPTHRPGVAIDQFVLGTAGAPFYQGEDYAGNNGSWSITHVKHIELTYGYTLGEVSGDRVSLFFMGRIAPGVYEPLDTFSYRAGAEPAVPATVAR
jgi:3',5'-cyclic AMP phosphodiesterase CpdA